MRALEFSRCALSISVAAILLSACSGSSMPMRATNNVSGDAGTSNSKTFHYTGKKQKFIVPSGVTQLTVVARGAEGGGFAYYPSSNSPGLGGRVYAVIPVHSRERLFVFVGGSGAHGGFNGGGAGGSEYQKYPVVNPGGGASDVRKGGDALQDRIIVAAGGGGAGVAVYTYGTGYGGKGGGLTGLSGGGGGSDETGGGGGGGTQSEGGSGGAGGGGTSRSSGYYPGQPGASGASGLGGNGGNGGPYGYGGGGGGGGGGYYGGGGGGGGGIVYYESRYESSQGGGGGGGSSYVEPSAITSRTWTGWKKANGDGQVVFSWQ